MGLCHYRADIEIFGINSRNSRKGILENLNDCGQAMEESWTYIHVQMQSNWKCSIHGLICYHTGQFTFNIWHIIMFNESVAVLL